MLPVLVSALSPPDSILSFRPMEASAVAGGDPRDRKGLVRRVRMVPVRQPSDDIGLVMEIPAAEQTIEHGAVGLIDGHRDHDGRMLP